MTNDVYRWTPPGLSSEEVEQFLSIQTGIPQRARDALAVWVTDYKTNGDAVDTEQFIRFQTASGIDTAFTHQDWARVDNVRRWFRELSERTMVYFIDFTLSGYKISRGSSYVPDLVEKLEGILYNAGAGWTIGEKQGRYGLVERVPAGVAVVVDLVLSTQDKASEMLRRAWNKAYGVTRSPSDAYHDAVKAVEILANPLISPNDADATLGKDINVLRTQAHKWCFVMAGSKHATAVEHLLSALQLLWHSQSDRHGKDDYQDVSEDEAKAAVLLASSIIGWLSQGALERTE